MFPVYVIGKFIQFPNIFPINEIQFQYHTWNGCGSCVVPLKNGILFTDDAMFPTIGLQHQYHFLGTWNEHIKFVFQNIKNVLEHCSIVHLNWICGRINWSSIAISYYTSIKIIFCVCEKKPIPNMLKILKY